MGSRPGFGYYGDGIDAVTGALRRARNPAVRAGRHEEATVFMAVRHTKYTGRRFCISTQGPGAMHLLNGLYDAKLDGKPWSRSPAGSASRIST
ncbi:thiamine pyrophosphate-binding protein [Micromonosporaceae bacterium Da 78-11]